MAGILRISFLSVLLLSVLPSCCYAVQVYYENCLPPDILALTVNGEQHLQWEPAEVQVEFNRTGNRNLTITVYGNVTGQASAGPLPPANDPSWSDPEETFGKIVDYNQNTSLWTTLFARFNVLNYVPWSDPGVRFCNYTDADCPLAPVPGSNIEVEDLHSFSYSHNLGGTYSFTTIIPRLWVVNGDRAATPLACIVAYVTPDLGSTVKGLLTYLPLLVLILVGIATASAAIFSPWGTWDIFRWTSNYGRDAIQLRLITPGFGDCLQYIQFVVLSGALSLSYPGFYQPAVSQVSWSSLMFNRSFVTNGDGYQAVVDGVYHTNSTYGLGTMSQLVGMDSDQDMWAGMIIWLLVIIATLGVLVQIGFAARWVYRAATKTQEEDMRAKNWPFTAGNAVRVVFNYFFLPVIALSMYQLTIAGSGISIIPAVFAGVTILVVLAFSFWLLWLINTARPRSWLFDDLPTVLLYGPLYNTYSDHAAPFALIPMLITFIRGIAIGAVQISGVAQIVMLSICEVINILALNAFRPFSSPTSMNAYHTVFSVVRLITILLMVAFIPALEIADSTRGWIGYVILLLHAIVLFAGFFLHSLQTGIEVIARLAGAGGEGDTTAMGGFVRAFGLRQLSRRNKRQARQARESTASNAAILEQHEKATSGTRSRSVSVNSNLLLSNRNPMSDPRQSVALDSITGGRQSHSGSGGIAHTPSTPGNGPSSAYSLAPAALQTGTPVGNGALANLKSMEPSDPYFRAPRPRRATNEIPSSSSKNRGSLEDEELENVDQQNKDDTGEGPSISGRATPAYARERADSNPDKPKTDYATREVDYYYGVRGPALSHMPTRKLKTGPADPTGPVSSATGWFKNLFGGKTKDQGKGFEVIRSSRMQPQEQEAEEIDLSQPYRDEPSSPPKVKERTRHFELDDEGDAVGGGTRRLPEDSQPSSNGKDDGESIQRSLGKDGTYKKGIAPILPAIDAGSSIHLPSRFPSAVSARHSGSNAWHQRDEVIPDVPEVPRKSSKRNSSIGPSEHSTEREARLPTIAASPPGTSHTHQDWPLPSSTLSPHQRIPFGGLSPNSEMSRPHNRSRSGDSRVSALSTLSNEDETDSRDKSGPSGALDGYMSSRGDERPSSLGYVQQHRASDNIHTVNVGDQEFRGSQAELVDENTVAQNASTGRPSR